MLDLWMLSADCTLPQTVVHLAIISFAMWVILDSVLVATDLKAAESEIKNLQGQIRFQNNQTQLQSMVNHDTLKNVQENNLILCELMMHMISMQQSHKRSFQADTSMDDLKNKSLTPPRHKLHT